MGTVERICPQCGTGNPPERERCLHCGVDLVHLPAVSQNRLPQTVRLPQAVENAGAVALVVGATALIARAGLNLMVRELLPRMVRGWLARPSRRTVTPARQAPGQVQSDERPDYVVRGWTSWTVQRGAERSSGSEQFEYHVKRKGRP